MKRKDLSLLIAKAIPRTGACCETQDMSSTGYFISKSNLETGIAYVALELRSFGIIGMCETILRS